jgi:hypothetical protein
MGVRENSFKCRQCRPYSKKLNNANPHVYTLLAVGFRLISVFRALAVTK